MTASNQREASMTKITSSMFIAALLGICLHVAPAQAQYVRTCVSANGNDANTCHCSQPCRTFQRAHDQTLSDGEVTVLDPGGYGPVTITKSISIVNDGVGEASIQVSGGGTGIIINAPNGAGYVNLRGITIQGVGFGGGIGLRFNTGFSLTITNCVVRNHTGNGIEFFPSASSTLEMSNTLVADNGGSGILVQPIGSSTIARVVVSRSEVYNNSAQGLFVNGTFGTGVTHIHATVADSVVAGNRSHGIRATSNTTQQTIVILVRSVAASNGVGVLAEGVHATVRVGQSTISGNGGFGWVGVSDGTVLSYGDNNVDGNGGDQGVAIIPKR